MKVNSAAAGLLLASGLCSGQLYLISTVAGGGVQASPFAATSASISPLAVATDTAGNVYFTNINSVFKLDRNGAATLVAGKLLPGFQGDGGRADTSQLNSPRGVAIDARGNLFIADTNNSRVRMVSPGGIIATVAGGGVQTADGGPATNASIGNPVGVVIDTTGNLFIASSDGHVRKVAPNGIITTLAGAIELGCGPVTLSNFPNPGIAVDSAGNLLLSSCARIVKVSPGGIITNVVGTGTPGFSGDGGPATSAQVGSDPFYPMNMALDSAGNLFIGDLDNGRVRRISPGGIITTVAGTGIYGSSGDGVQATSAQLNEVFSLTADQAGNLYIATADRIRKVSLSGIITTVAGGGAPALGDGGPAVDAQLPGLHGVALDSVGNLFTADNQTHRIRRVSPDGLVTTVAGNGTAGYSGDGGPATAAQLSSPSGVAVDSANNLYIADFTNNLVRKVSPDGIIRTVAGNGGYVFSGDGGPATSAHLSSPSRVAVDSAGNLFISDQGNARIRKVLPNGVITTVAGTGVFGFSGDNGPGTSAQLAGPADLALDNAGNLFMVDGGRVRKLSPDGLITTVVGVVGNAAACPKDGGTAFSVFVSPGGVAVDSAGNLFITSCDRIWRVSPGGTVSFVAGNGIPGFTGDGGPANGAQFSFPNGLTIDGAGDLFVADSFGNPFSSQGGAIRRLQPTNQTVLIGAVLDAASESRLAVSPGKIVVIYGAGLGPSQLVSNQPANGVFGTKLAGTTVTMNGLDAPVIYTSATQVAAIAPYGVSDSAIAQVTVSSTSGISPAFAIPVAASAPSFFSQNGTGAGQAAVVNLDGSLNDAAHPVKVGGYVSLYATGEGQTSPAGVDGRLAATAPYPQPLLPVIVTVGGVPAPYAYAGAAPTLVAGLMQINIRIPEGVQPGGYVPLVLTVGNASTVDGAAWIAVSGN